MDSRVPEGVHTNELSADIDAATLDDLTSNRRDESTQCVQQNMFRTAERLRTTRAPQPSWRLSSAFWSGYHVRIHVIGIFVLIMSACFTSSIDWHKTFQAYEADPRHSIK